MGRDGTLGIKRAGIVMVAALAAIGCGSSLPGNGGPGGAGGAAGGAGAPADCCPTAAPYMAQPIVDVIRAQAFTAYEGRPVKAAFVYSTTGRPTETRTRETSVSGGAFDLDFQTDDPICPGPGSAGGTGAIFIDVDGDGVCNPSTDYLYLWSGLATKGSRCATFDLTPQSAPCGGEDADANFYAFLDAAKAVCPAIKDCLSCDGGQSYTCLI
jgi:hypothetical protein